MLYSREYVFTCSWFMTTFIPAWLCLTPTYICTTYSTILCISSAANIHQLKSTKPLSTHVLPVTIILCTEVMLTCTSYKSKTYENNPLYWNTPVVYDVITRIENIYLKLNKAKFSPPELWPKGKLWTVLIPYTLLFTPVMNLALNLCIYIYFLWHGTFTYRKSTIRYKYHVVLLPNGTFT